MNRTITQLVILARTFADELEGILQSTASPEAAATPEAPTSAPKRRGRPAAAATTVAEPTQQATAEPTKEEKAEGMSLDELKALIKPAIDAAAGLQIKELIRKHGGSQLADLPAANHAAFAADVEGLVY